MKHDPTQMFYRTVYLKSEILQRDLRIKYAHKYEKEGEPLGRLLWRFASGLSE